MIRAIQAIPNLLYLNLGGTCQDFDWAVHFKAIFGSMEEDKGLRAFVVQNPRYDRETRTHRVRIDFSWLELLLSRTRYNMGT